MVVALKPRSANRLEGDVEQLLPAPVGRQPLGGVPGRRPSGSPSGASVPALVRSGHGPRPSRRSSARNVHPADSKTRPIRPGRSREREVAPGDARGCARAGVGPGASSEAGRPPTGRRGRTSGSRRRRARRPPGRARWRAAGRWTADSTAGLPNPSHVDAEDHDVARGVGVDHVRAGHRRRPPRPCTTRAAGPGQQAVELGAVAVLGRAEEPERGAHAPRPAPGRRPRSCGGWPGWAGARAGSSGAEPEGLARCRAGRRRGRRRRRRCAPRWPRSRARQFAPAQVVDGDVDPARVVGRRGMAGELLALPGQVVVVQHGPAGPAGPRPRPAAAGVEGERTQVLHHHQVGARQGVVDLAVGRGVAGASMASPGQEVVDRARAGHRADVEAQVLEGAGPFRRLDRPPRRNRPGGRRRGRRPGRGHEPATLPGPWQPHRAGPWTGGRALPSLACPSPSPRRCEPRRGLGDAEVLYQVDAGGVARITINRPERRNAMSWEVMRGLRDALAEAAKADPAVRVVVLTGAGDEAFCAGADLGRHGRRRTSPTTGFLARPRGARRAGRGVRGPLAPGQAHRSPVSRAAPWPAGSAWPWPATWWWRPTGPGSGPPRSTWACGRT